MGKTHRGIKSEKTVTTIVESKVGEKLLFHMLRKTNWLRHLPLKQKKVSSNLPRSTKRLTMPLVMTVIERSDKHGRNSKITCAKINLYHSILALEMIHSVSNATEKRMDISTQ